MKRPSVRIIAGRWKGRRLVVPDGARPTSDRAREALFSILQKRIPGAKVLDLYAGSGAVGLESVSRGAARATLVEKNAPVLRQNLVRLPPPHDEVDISGEDVASAIDALARKGVRFDLVFADPPYGTDPRAIRSRAGSLLADGGLFILQADRDASPPRLEGLTLVETRDYGRNVFFFFSKNPEARPSKSAPAL